jgi:mono/diheme cytochrome c family protein
MGIAVVAAVLVGRWYFSDTATAAGQPIVSVTVPELSAADKIGEKAFNKNCASCHGVNATGLDGLGPPLVHKIYEPNHHGDMSFQMAAQRGVRAHHWRFGNMPPVEGITLDEIAVITAYIRTLQRANGIH